MMEEKKAMSETVKTAKELFRYYLSKQIPVMVEGPPGVGKSEMIAQVADEAGIGFIDVRLGQMDPVDLRGLPAINKAREGMLSTTWARPDFLPTVERDGEEGIILFDELSDCGKMMQSAAYQPILNGRVGPHIIPKGWYRCGAGNRQKDKAGAQPMSSALANRFAWVEVEADVECFREYGHKIGMHYLVLGFIKHRPALLHDMKSDGALRAFPSPRSWHKASLVCDAPADIRMKLVRGCVGEGAAGEFEAFLRAIDLPDIEEIIADPRRCRIPEQPAHKYALASMLAQYAKRDNFDKLTQYSKRDEFGKDFEICFMLDATKRETSLTETKAFVEFANRNPNLML
jgi:hypothetical protein